MSFTAARQGGMQHCAQSAAEKEEQKLKAKSIGGNMGGKIQMEKHQLGRRRKIIEFLAK